MTKKQRAKKIKQKTFIYPFGREEIRWADMARVKFAEEKFLITFAQVHPDKDEYTVMSEIILPPKVAASLSTILSSAVADYDKIYGQASKPRRKKEK
jgi:hypothetical protein